MNEAYRHQVSLYQEIFKEGDLVLEKIHTQENPTFMLTKVFRELSSTIVRTFFTSFQLLEFDEACLNKLRVA